MASIPDIAIALAATVAITDTPVHAQEAKLIGRFGDWEAYTRGGKDDRFCYIVSKPKEASLRSRRGDIFLLVWHRPAKDEFDVVQIDAGYSFKKESQVEVKIGGEDWQLFTRDSNAWTYRGDDDANIVQAMRKGARLTVKGGAIKRFNADVCGGSPDRRIRAPARPRSARPSALGAAHAGPM